MYNIEELTTLFHSINDIKISEKWKHFNKFFQLIESNLHSEDDLNRFVNSLIPKTPIEEIFRLEIILKLKRNDVLLEEINNSNYMLIKKLLKNWRLFAEIFSKIPAEELVNKIFLNLSYIQKLKVLNGICKNITNETLLDEYFKVLEKKYGLKTATILLPGCSINLIKSNVEKYHLKLTNAHLKRIFKKDKQFVQFYFKIIKQKYQNINLSDNYSFTLKYIAKIDPKIYWELCEEFDLHVKFGKYMTPKMIKSNDNIVVKGESTIGMFHLLKMYKTMKKEGKLDDFLLNFYPKAHCEFSNILHDFYFRNFLKKMPRSTQYTVISTIFNRKYEKNLLEYPKYFTKDLLKIAPLKEREEILKTKIEEDKDLFCFYSTAVTIPQFKERLQHTSDAEQRRIIMEQLYETCAVNCDEDALLDVLKYILTRHRNDTSIVFLFTQILDWPRKNKLTAEHWRCLGNIAKLLELSRTYLYNSSLFYERYIHYLVKNDKPYNEVIEHIVKAIVEDRQHGFYSFSNKTNLEIYFDEIAKCLEKYKENEKYQHMVLQFLNQIAYERTSKNLLSKYQYLFDQLKVNDWETRQVVARAIKLNNPKIHELFWKVENTGKDNEIFLWYAKNLPEVFKENINKVLIRSTYSFKRFLQKLKFLVDADTINEIKEISLKNIEKEDYDKAITATKAISVLAPEAFLKIVPNFLPEDDKINLEEAKEKVNLQQVLVKNLSNINDPLKSFPLITKFCIGDYLKFGLPALYSVTYNAPEKYVKNFLSQFSNTAVSVRKHVLTLGRHLLTADDFHHILNEWNAKEKNLSMRNILLKKAVEYFIDNPSENFWNLIKTNVNTIDTADKCIYEFLIKFQNIPLNYQPKYLELIYKELAKNSDNEINSKKYQLIDEIPDSIIDSLNEEFIIEVIKETVCVETDTKFHWRCVFHTNAPKQFKFFEKNFKIFENFINKTPLEYPQKFKSRSKIRNFLINFFNLCLELKQNKELIEKFMSSWRNLFNSEQFGMDYLLIRFTYLYFVTSFDIYETGVEINKLLYEYIEKYNNSIVHSFCKQLNTFLETASISDDHLLKFVNGFFANKKDQNIYVAVINFLPTTVPEVDNAYADYVPILEEIKKCDIPLVQYYLDSYFTKNNHE